MSRHFRLALAAAALAMAAGAPARADAIQCAPFARMFSGIQLFGNAYTWWSQALGRYARGTAPKEGAVLVFKAAGVMRVGHVATVTKIVSDRVIKVTHANWSHGRVDRDVTVEDASAANDWSRVKVWFTPIRSLGTTAYPVYGFIYNGKVAASDDVAASCEHPSGILTRHSGSRGRAEWQPPIGRVRYSRNRSLMPVLARVCASTRLTITAQ